MMMQRFLLWLRSYGNHDDDEPTAGVQAVEESRIMLKQAENQTVEAEKVAAAAATSRARNHYADALRATYRRTHPRHD